MKKLHDKIEDMRKGRSLQRAKLWRSIWNRGIKLWWYRLWVRKDEFHTSLNMDTEAMLDMTDAERRAYLNDLCKRRNLAHERDMWENT